MKLILPINDAMLTASMKTEAYTKRFSCVHYGVDLISRQRDRVVFASGKGTVVACGVDRVVGNVVAIRYPSAENRKTGKTCDLILRYFHLDRVNVMEGQAVTKDTILGLYGETGSMTVGRHLHLEADADTMHPLHSPTVLRSDFLRGRAESAHDRTVVNPVDWLHCKTSKPDFQSWTTAGDIFCAAGDRLMENIL